MAELNSVGDKGGFCGGVDYLEAAVVLQGGADVEAVAGAAQEARVRGFLWMSMCHPMGPRGVVSKLKGPLKSLKADVWGGAVDWRGRLSDSSV